MQDKSTISQFELKGLFSNIVEGFNVSKSEKFGNLYFKHLKLYESAIIESGIGKYEETAKKEGLSTEKEQLDFLYKEELWSEEKEREVQDKITYINGLKGTIVKTFIKQKRLQLEELVKKEEKGLVELIREREELMGFTVERYAAKKANEEYVFHILYKDKEFKELFFSREEFDELDDVTITEIIKIYNEVGGLISDENIKRLALTPFFLNIYYLCEDNPYHFYGKPVLELTYHQNELFAHARYFKHLLSESKSRPPQEVMDDPDKFIRWFESGKEAEKIMEKAGDKANTAVSLMGATKEDLEALGLDNTEAGGRTLSLSEAAKKKGGSLDMKDLIQLHGA